MKKIVYICILFLISCSSDEKISVELKPDIIEVITNTNSIDGIVYASCGVCNFGLKESYECFLAIKVGDTVFPVEGSKPLLTPCSTSTTSAAFAYFR